MNRRTWLAAGAAASLSLTLGCGPGAAPTAGGGGAGGDTVVIVSSLPRTGSAKGQTDTIVHGIQMAFEEAGNKAGPFTIVYQDLDDATAADGKWTAEREQANAEKAVTDPDCMAFIGPYNTGAAKVSMPITNKGGLLMISPAVTSPTVTKPNTGEPNEPGVYRPTGKVNFTRVVPADDLQGPLAADWAKSMGVKSVVVLDDNEAYGKGIATLFAERCGEIGIKVIGNQQSIDYKQNDFRGLMNQIGSGEKPDLVYLGGTSQTKAGQIAKDMASSGLKGVKLMVPDGCYELAFIQSAGADTFKVVPTFCTFGGLPPDKLTGQGAEFVKKYQAKYGKQPEGYAIYGYEAGKVAIDAIKRAGKKDRAAVLAAALAIKDFDGALGKWSFDANGDTTSTTMSGSTVENGDWKFVAQLDTLNKK